MHGVTQNEPLPDTTLCQGFPYLTRDIYKGPARGDMKPKFPSMTFHVEYLPILPKSTVEKQKNDQVMQKAQAEAVNGHQSSNGSRLAALSLHRHLALLQQGLAYFE
jgi:hypothetical protein